MQIASRRNIISNPMINRKPDYSVRIENRKIRIYWDKIMSGTNRLPKPWLNFGGTGHLK
jgi:hypothetical protein